MADEVPHFVLLPFSAPGHMNPMVDIAKLLAKCGVSVSLLLTPHNHSRFKKVVDRATASGLSIRVSHLTLPGTEFGLPQGCENFDMLSSMNDAPKFFGAIAMLQDQVEDLLLQLRPTCFIADMCFPWANDIALKLHIPWLVFRGTSCFSLLCINFLYNSKILDGVASDTEYFVLPDIPDRIEITKQQLRGTAYESPPEWNEIRKKLSVGAEGAAGIVANTFQELEPEYIKEYMKTKGKKVWCIGPVSLCNTEYSDKAERGKRGATDGLVIGY